MPNQMKMLPMGPKTVNIAQGNLTQKDIFVRSINPRSTGSTAITQIAAIRKTLAVEREPILSSLRQFKSPKGPISSFDIELKVYSQLHQ